MVSDVNLIRQVLAFINADTWGQWEHMLRLNSALLNEEVDTLLDQMLQEAAGDPALRTTIELRRNLLRRAREAGIDAAFEHLRGPVNDQEPQDPRTTAAYQKIEALEQMQAESDPDETMMHPDVYKGVVLRSVLQSYDAVLETQQDSPVDYGLTQLNRAKVLHQLSGLRGEKHADRLNQALASYDAALGVLESTPRDYAVTQSNRAALLYQLALLPNEDHIQRLEEALAAYEAALGKLQDVPHLYMRTQLSKVALLRDMAGLPGENRAARLYAALEGFNQVLALPQHSPEDYARIQLPRANLLRELAGLQGEQRSPRMLEALQAYQECLRRLPHNSRDYAITEINRASLLQEIATLPGENTQVRLQQALLAALRALQLLPESDSQYRTAQRMLNHTRKTILNAMGETTFNQWWGQFADFPQPDWLGNPRQIGV